MKSEVVVDGIVLTRGQVEQAYAKLSAPEPLEPFKECAKLRFVKDNVHARFVVPSSGIASMCEPAFGSGPDEQFVICTSPFGMYKQGYGYVLPLADLKTAF